MFLLEKKPFSKATLEEYEKRRGSNSFLKVSSTSNGPMNLTSPKKLLASPNLKSKFSPSLTISKSPACSPSKAFKFELEPKEEADSKDLLFRLSGKDKIRSDKKSSTLKEPTSSPNKLSSIKQIPVNRKPRNNLKEIEKKPSTIKKKPEYNDLPLIGAFKQTSGKVQKNSGDNMQIDAEYSIAPIEEGISAIDLDKEPVKHEGWLYKITESKQLKKLWFSLLHKDLYCKIILIYFRL
jgi:hypothetical protein